MSTKNKKAAAEQVSEVASTLKIKFKKNAIALNLCYLPGDVAELETKQAELAIELGFAVLADTENQEAEDTENTENTAAQIAEDVQPENE